MIFLKAADDEKKENILKKTNDVEWKIIFLKSSNQKQANHNQLKIPSLPNEKRRFWGMVARYHCDTNQIG